MRTNLLGTMMACRTVGKNMMALKGGEFSFLLLGAFLVSCADFENRVHYKCGLVAWLERRERKCCLCCEQSWSHW